MWTLQSSCTTNGETKTLDEIFRRPNTLNPKCFENVRIMELNTSNLTNSELKNLRQEIEKKAFGMEVQLDEAPDIMNFVVYPQALLKIILNQI